MLLEEFGDGRGVKMTPAKLRATGGNLVTM